MNLFINLAISLLMNLFKNLSLNLPKSLRIQRSLKFLIVIFFLQTFLVAFTFAETKPCSRRCSSYQNSVVQTQKDICLAECEIFYKENPEARPSKPHGVCENLSERLKAQIDPSKKLNQILSCGSGVWDGVLGIPDQILAYINLALAAKTSLVDTFKNKQNLIKSCEEDLQCKIALSKKLISLKTASEEEIRIHAQENHAKSLLEDVARQQQIKQNSCYEKASVIRGKITRDQILKNQNSGSVEAKRAEEIGVYKELSRVEPECPSLLGLINPEEDTNKQDPQSSWLERLGIKLQCYSTEKVTELLCFEAASLILDPLALIAGGGLYLKTMASAGMKKSSIATAPNPRAPPSTPRRQPKSYNGRKDFTSAYLHQEFTTEAQNRAWIELARKPRSETSDYVFMDLENSKMKFLNDTLKDKDLVTAITNRHKEITLEYIEALRLKYPGIDIREYSDFKSLRFAIGHPKPPHILDELNTVLREANQKFHDEMVSKSILRATDDSKNWFRAGVGETADEANAAARFSRGQSDNTLRNFSDSKVQASFTEKLQDAEALRIRVTQNPRAQGLFESVNNGDHLIPKKDIFEIARKYPHASEIREQISARYKINLTETDAQDLLRYVDLADQFSPGIHVPTKVVATVAGASKGAISMDFTGMGAYNLLETASALARSKNTQEALEQTRIGERFVTENFENRMKERASIIENFLLKKKGLEGLEIRCSGDDCVSIFPSRISPKDQKDLVQRLSRTDSPSGVRVSFISSNVKDPNMRNQLATHGEALEKETRKALVGKIPDSILKNVTLGVAMRGAEVGRGGV
jgi:hypothetical protein